MAHMKPVADYLTAEEATEYTAEPGETAEAGWYGRLSAAGYMDCSEWSGPFKTEEQALNYVMEFYEVDEDGNGTDEC